MPVRDPTSAYLDLMDSITMPRKVLRPLTLVAILAVLAVVVGAQAPTPKAADQITASFVVQLLERGHMAKPKIDDEIAKRWCKNFLKELDPQKHYFEKSDITEFMAQATTLDDEVRKGNLDFPRLVFDRFLKRADERQAAVTELLTQKYDFTTDESISDDPDLYDYPANSDEARERWRKRVKLDLLQLKTVDKTEGEEAIKKLRVRYKDRNRAFHQFDMGDLLEVYLSSLTRTFDPHSSYMNAKTFEDMMGQQLHLSLDGIGASLQSEDGYATVKEIVPGMAADKDGRLQVDDKIVAIEKEDGTEIDLVEKKLSDIVRFIRGPRGTKVRLIVQPAGTKERKIYELTRQKIELVENHAKGRVIETRGEKEKSLKIGVVSLPAFYGDTRAIMKGEKDAVSATEDCRKIIKGFKEKGVDAILVDLRGNGGGLLSEAVSLSGLFIDEGPVVQVKDATGVRHLDDDDEGTAWDGPLVVMIDHLSASASEIFAGVIKDYARGLIIGDSSTFGKGTVQQIVEINEQLRSRDYPPLGALKLTIQQFYRANGESTQVKGVTPHIHIPSLRDQADFGEGKMDNAMKFDKVEERKHDMYNRVPPDLISVLETRSWDRRKADPKFQKQDERIKKYAERKARHTISLNETKFKAEFVPDEDGDGKPDEDKPKTKEKRKRFHEKSVWEPDYYNDEVMRIVADYLTLGSKVLVAAPVRAQASR
ncbi:MAG: carboxy terminal-processing peptidase [Isosphaeraceae bacterium]